MGPALLFDKSFLQGLSADEAAILDQLFACTIAPLFFSETLADLAKEPKGGRDPARVIAELAAKTPVCHGYMNTFHGRAIVDELLGETVPMEGRPLVAGGIPVPTKDGMGIVHKRSPETLAFERWQHHRFSDVERIAAGIWRRQLGELDLPAIRAAFQALLKKQHRPRNPQEAKALAGALIDAPGQSYRTLRVAFELLNLPPEAFKPAVEQWRRAGSKPLRAFAPYTAFCLEIDLYFCLCLSNGIISDQRANNKVDMGYLYYAPFAHAFVSSDRLHQAHAPVFLTGGQRFIWGPDLKADLAALNSHFQGLPDADKAQGLFKLATKPPTDSDGLTASCWDQFRSGWREAKPVPQELPPDIERTIVDEGRELIAAADFDDLPPPPRSFLLGGDEIWNRVLIQRAIPRERGSWRMFLEDFERRQDARSSD